MADDALSCFKSLLDTVPTWLEELQEILKGAAEKQEEILFANKPSDSGIHTPSKTPSLQSRISATGSDHAQQIVVPIRPALQHLTNSDALRLSQRKRKTASIMSGESGPSRFRTKYAAVVYYDGDTQNRFEKLVRAVGLSRNAIRKGKMSAKVDSLSLYPRSSFSSEDDDDSSGEEYHTPITTKMGFRTTANRATGYSAFVAHTADIEAFDRIDGRLEKGQALCERAAHQILRDGDCTQEVTQAREHFTEALRQAKDEIPVLEQKAQKAAERRQKIEEKRRIEEEKAAQKAAADAAVKRIADASNSNDIAPAPSPAVLVALSGETGEGRVEADHIEVDSNTDDSDGEEFDLTTLPRFGGKFGAMRSARLAAQA
jgi:hypothetical protein